MKKRVLVAMSGGVDSSVAAYLLKEKGYEVAGATMKIWPKELCGKQPLKACCSLRSIEDARSVCRQLNIPFYVLNLTRQFEKEVIAYFIEQYRRGLTPNPCIMCNEKIKFGVFLNKARALGFDYIATGHYARRAFDKGLNRFQLKEALDKTKDQSYVLFPLTQEQLSRSIFPLGGVHRKSYVRTLAKRIGLRIHNKPDSQEICFVLGDYKDFLKARLKDRIKPGAFIYRDSVMGRHKGICFYTIGQRKGLGLGHHKSLYVIKIDKSTNAIFLGDREDLNRKTFYAGCVNWVSIKEPKNKIQVLAKIRYNHKKSEAVVSEAKDGNWRVDFLKEQCAITPGQAVVFYKGERVLGGGWIK